MAEPMNAPSAPVIEAVGLTLLTVSEAGADAPFSPSLTLRVIVTLLGPSPSPSDCSVAAETVASLPYGTRHFVEIARALVGGPHILLLDEPATGLTDAERERLGTLVRRVATMP